MNIRIPISWLRDYLKTDLSAKTLANFLSVHGPSVEKLEKRARDIIFDVEITANRFDTASIIGIAREAFAILAAQNQKSTLISPKGSNLNLQPERSNPLPLDVVIKDQSLSPRFTAIVVENIKIKPSPAYIKNRLEASGIRSINNIVDISNYLMLELGQPMHTFDYDKIKGAKMILRASRPEEKIKTLDGVLRILPEGSIVIEDSLRLIDLCGIMGAANSQITSRTKKVVFFVQAYNPLKIRKTTQSLAFRTDAAARFEKGVDIEGIPQAISKAVYLAKHTAGARIASELIDIYPTKLKAQKIKLSLDKLNKYLGLKINPQEANSILKNLGFDTKFENNTILAIPPSWREQDIDNDVDLIEEIARIYGYHNLPTKLPEGQIPQSTESELKNVINLKRALKYLGLTEIISYSIISKSELDFSKVPKNQVVELANPLSDNWQFMRPSIIPSLVKIISENRHLKSNMQIFEIAKTYIFQKGNLPKQDLYLSIVLQNALFSQIKGLVENTLEILRQNAKWQKPQKDSALFEKNQSAQIKISDQLVGTLGLLKREIATNFSINSTLVAAEINLTSIYQLPSIPHTYKPIPKYPPVIEDISAIFAKMAPVDEIIEKVKKVSQLVKKVEVVDIYEGEELKEDKKSVTLRLYYQKSSQTPTHGEVETERLKIISSLQKEYRAKIRE